jgi:predicted NUDIX family NTP pyrophosphohydrolase
MQTSAGTLLYRRGVEGVEVLLVHASGNFNRHAPWGIPKGIPNPGESLVDAARRETLEETGVVSGELAPLGDVVYRSHRKQLHCFCGEAPSDAAPRCASWEIDAAEFVPIDKARARIHRDQALFLDRLTAMLSRISASLGAQND